MVTMTSLIGFFAVKVIAETAVLSIDMTARSPTLRLLAAPTDVRVPLPPPLLLRDWVGCEGAETLANPKTENPFGELASKIRLPLASVPVSLVVRISWVPSSANRMIRTMLASPAWSATHPGLTLIRMVASAMSRVFSSFVLTMLRVYATSIRFSPLSEAASWKALRASGATSCETVVVRLASAGRWVRLAEMEALTAPTVSSFVTIGFVSSRIFVTVPVIVPPSSLAGTSSVSIVRV